MPSVTLCDTLSSFACCVRNQEPPTRVMLRTVKGAHLFRKKVKVLRKKNFFKALPSHYDHTSRMNGEFLRLLFLQAHRETTAHFIAPRGGKNIGVTDQPQYPRL